MDNARSSSRNVWGSYKDAKLNIKGDSVFYKITQKLNLKEDFDFSKVTNDASGAPITPSEFKPVVGLELSGKAVTNWVHPYEVDNTTSADKTRYKYTAFVFDAEDEYQVFAQQGHPILTDPNDLEAVKVMAGKTSLTNFEAKAERIIASGKTPSVKLVPIVPLAETRRALSTDLAAIS